ncbi:hypothetical protein KY342_01850, partial [Candidatus Woesearchaeota archaeon]|nr:hypothetical protein [Candidatus Woesearchaeota archaeon]
MAHYLVEKGFIPLDKSWIIRMGILDLLDKNEYTIKFLKERFDESSDDLKALYNSSIDWRECKLIRIGESGTLYRFLRFASWKL